MINKLERKSNKSNFQFIPSHLWCVCQYFDKKSSSSFYSQKKVCIFIGIMSNPIVYYETLKLPHSLRSVGHQEREEVVCKSLFFAHSIWHAFDSKNKTTRVSSEQLMLYDNCVVNLIFFSFFRVSLGREKIFFCINVKEADFFQMFE